MKEIEIIETQVVFTDFEKSEYSRLKAQAKQGWLLFAEAIVKIRDSKLYKIEYNTFEEFCGVELGISDNYARRLMLSVDVVENLKSVPIGTLLPNSESQARPLTKLEPELQAKAWAEVVSENPKENITAKVISEKVDEYKPLNIELREDKQEITKQVLSTSILKSEADIQAEIDRKASEKAKELLKAFEEEKNRKSEQKSQILEQKKQENALMLSNEVKGNAPQIYLSDCIDFLNTLEDNSQDLLITDPPYSTDVEDIKAFAESWVNLALKKVKPNGRAFICIGAYPKEMQAYLNVLLAQDKFILDNPLIWTYKNTLGVTPKMKYNLNYQVVLHLYSPESRELDTSITNEMFSVMEINAPDGRLGNRYHTWQKPDELAMRLIKHATVEGDTLFDCFACTGTFLLMGAKMNRTAIGCDISKENLKIARERGANVII